MPLQLGLQDGNRRLLLIIALLWDHDENGRLVGRVCDDGHLADEAELLGKKLVIAAALVVLMRLATARLNLISNEEGIAHRPVGLLFEQVALRVEIDELKVVGSGSKFRTTFRGGSPAQSYVELACIAAENRGLAFLARRLQ